MVLKRSFNHKGIPKQSVCVHHTPFVRRCFSLSPLPVERTKRIRTASEMERMIPGFAWDNRQDLRIWDRTRDFPSNFRIKRESLVVYKKVLLDCVKGIDLKELMKHLVKSSIISQKMSKYLYNLDYDRLEHEVVAGFLVNELLRSIQSGKVESLVDKLEKMYSDSKHLCDVVRRCLLCMSTESAIVGNDLGSPIETASTYTGIDHKRSLDILTFKDIPYLIETLYKCSKKWEELGIALQLSGRELAECRMASSNALSLCMVLSKRLSQHTNTKSVFTVQTLKYALRSDSVGMISLAESIEETLKEMKMTSRLQLQLVENSPVLASDGKPTLVGLPMFQETEPYQWKKNEKKLHNNSYYYGVCDDVLLIKSACQGMEGEYSCYTNDGKLVSKVCLKVKFSDEKRKLLARYDKLKEVPNTWPPVGASTFVELALVHNDRHHVNNNYDYSVRGDMDDILERKRKAKYVDCFSSIENGILVLIEGRPGCGKTTLTHKITRDWARGPDILNEAHELFHVSLRILALKDINSLSGILNIIYHNGEISQKVVDKLDNNDGEGACFIIDGLDEYKERDNPDNLIYQLINKEYLPKAMIIVASRPVGTVNVRDRASMRVEVLGFSKDQIKAYLEAYSFKAGISSVSSLDAFLKNHVNVYHMCYLPVHAAMICYIYDNCSGEIPSTETKIYELFTLLTIRRMLKTNNDSTKITSLRMLKGSLQKSFHNVCKLAFDMTVSSKQAALESDIESHLSDEVGSNIHSLGLVTIDSTARLLDFEHLYSFLHLTFQEFLAAFHLANLDGDTQLIEIRECVSKSEMLVVWKFYCGLVKFYNSNHDQRLELIMTSMKTNDLYRFQCALESEQRAVSDSAFINGENTSHGTICIRDHTFLSVDFNALGYSIANTSFHVTELVFANCILSLEGVQNLTGSVGHDKISLIKSFTFSTNGELEQFKIVNHILKKLKSLEILDLRNNTLCDKSIRFLSNKVELFNLKVLKIRMPIKVFSFGNSSELLELLSFNSSELKQVHYSYVESEDESHSTSLMNILKSFQCEVIPLSSISRDLLCNLDVKLRRVSKFLNFSILLLVNCNLHDQDVECLTTTLKLDNVQTLRLDFNKLTCRSAKNLARFFPFLTNLTHLSISCNLIGNDGAIALAKALPHARTLSELDLQGNKIGDDEAIAIAHAVKDFPRSFCLNLWNINITPEGVAKVLENRSSADVEGKSSLLAMKYVNTISPEAVTRAVGCCESLHSLDFSGKHVSSVAALALEGSFKNCTNLKSVNLSKCSSKYDTLNSLGNGLKECKNLIAINFGDNRIGTDAILKLVSCCHDLQKLDIHGTSIGFQIRSVAGVLGEKKLQSLNLHNCKIEEYGAAALGRCFRLGAVGRQPLEKIHLIPGQEKFDDFLLRSLNINIYNLCEPQDSHSWCHYLVNLNLGSNGIGSAGAAALSYGLKCCHKLQSLDLSSNSIEADGAAILAHGLKSCSELKELVLDNNPLKDDGATDLFTALVCCSKLEVLSCQNMTYLEADYTSVASYSSLKKKSNFNESYPEISLKWTLALAQSMKHWSQFRNFNGNYNKIDRCSLVNLAEGFGNTSTLECLYLGNNKIALEGMKVLAQCLKGPHLKELDLKNNSISHLGMVKFKEILKNSSLLLALKMSMNLIGPLGAATLSEGLEFCRHLKLLELCGNDLGPNGIQALVKGLSCCIGLCELDLSDNGINAEGAIVLFDALKNLPNLELLRLGNNNFGCDGVRALVRWLIHAQQVSQSIVDLRIGHNNIGSDGASELAEGLSYAKTLQRLDIKSNSLGHNGSLELAKGLKFCTNLKIVWLDDNGIDHAGALELAESLSNSQLERLILLKNSSNIRGSELTNIVNYCQITTDDGCFHFPDSKKKQKKHLAKYHEESD